MAGRLVLCSPAACVGEVPCLAGLWPGGPAPPAARGLHRAVLPLMTVLGVAGCGAESREPLPCAPGHFGLDDDCAPDGGGNDPECGDGFVDPGEECDLGEANEDEGVCKADCTEQVCGDGRVGPDERCDDGLNEGTYGGCAPGCERPGPHCGDATVDGPETCDDGNTVNGDGCNDDCVASGTELWTRTHDGAGSGPDAGTGIATDLNGNVYVVGLTYTGARARNDIWIRKYDPDGNELWTRTSGDAADDFGGGIATDLSGNVLVTGTADITGGRAAWVGKYDPDGNEVWTEESTGDSGNGIAGDTDGNVVVVGATLSDDADRGFDAWIRKYDPDGGVLWTRAYDGEGRSTDTGNGVATDPDGNVVVVGTTRTDARSTRAWLRKYDPDGNEIWTRTHHEGETSRESGDDVAADMEGNVLATGSASGLIWLRKYDPDGNELWTRTEGGEEGGWDLGLGIAADADGNVVVAGVTDLAIWVRKYDPYGNELWTRTEPVPGSGNDVATDADGNVIVTGLTYTGEAHLDDIWVGKYAP